MNATQASLLAILDGCGGELTGGELVRVAQLRIGQFWSLTRSQVYRELASLDSDGLVSPGTPGARESRPFRITDAGREVYRTWLTTRLPSETIRIPVLLAVSFGAALDPTALRAVLETEQARHVERQRELERLDEELAALPEPDPWARATVRFGLLYEQAAREWFASLPADLFPAAPSEPPSSPQPAPASE